MSGIGDALLGAADEQDKQEKQRVRQREKELKKIIETQAQELDDLRKSKWTMPRAAHSTARESIYVRVILPDTHGSSIDGPAWNAVLEDLTHLKKSIKETILIGDHIDCGGFLAQHHTLGYVAESEYSFADDLNATNQFLDQLQRTCPASNIDYIEGNHERRVERWIVTETLRNQKDAQWLLNAIAPQVCLGLKKRNIPYHKQNVFHDGCRIPGTIKRGPCYFTHGSRTGPGAVRNMLKDFGSCVVFGHTHENAGVTNRTVADGDVGAWSVGCLCKLQPYYMHTQITRWSHAYGLQLVRRDKTFLHITVPIIDGKSLLCNFADKLKG